MAAAILPVVLAGGRSTRFGSDKLLAPLGDGTVLVDRPIAALRELLGAPVVLAGRCAPAVAARGDRVLDDPHPGIGPIGGILGALCAAEGPVFVLPGDLPAITAAALRPLLAAPRDAETVAILAETDRLEPCIGLYLPAARAPLRAAVASGRYALHAALAAERVRCVPIDPAAAKNANLPADLDG